MLVQNKESQCWVAYGLIILSLSIGLAAFGRHGVADEWSGIRWEIGVEYLRWTSVGVILMTLVRHVWMNGSGTPWPERVLVAGNLVFSGIICLEALHPELVQSSVLKNLPPFGGMGMMVGFVWMVLQIIQKQNPN